METEGHLIDHQLINRLLDRHSHWDRMAEGVSVFPIEGELEKVSLEHHFGVEDFEGRQRDLELERGLGVDLLVNGHLHIGEGDVRQVGVLGEA